MSLHRLSKIKLFSLQIRRNPQLVRNIFLSLAKYQKPGEEGDGSEVDKPAKYINSPAHKWRAEYTRRGRTSEARLWYEPMVVSGSIAVFLLYFCVYREESDIDIDLGRSLYSRIDGLEELQLRLSYNYNKEHGIDVADLERRMKELGMKSEQNQ